MTSPGLYPKTPTQFSRFIAPGTATNPAAVGQDYSGTARTLPPSQQEGGSFDHPVGTRIYYRDYITSTQNLTDIHISIANHILGECDSKRLPAAKDVTVCLHINGNDIEYYVVNHISKEIIWKIGQIPESFIDADPSKHEYEYWVHMMNFPGHRTSTAEDLRLLQAVLKSNSLVEKDSYATPEHSEAVFTDSGHLNPDESVYQTYIIAKRWVSVLQFSHESDAPSNNQILIDNDMSVSEILKHMCKRVQDVTELLDLYQCDEYPTQNGGYGDVYSGHMHLRDGSRVRVAIKCLRLTIEHSPEGRELVEAFSNELYVWSKCKHPNVMGLIGMAKYRNQFAMVSPWMHNGHLERLISRRDFPLEERYRLCIQIVEGVAYLHAKKIVHGDLNARNILMSSEGIPHLNDFGSSIIREHSLQFRSSGMERGFTMRWTAPELLLDGKAKPTYSGDIHSLGMTILEVITGAKPYADSHSASVFGLITSGVLPSRPMDRMPTGNSRADQLWSLLTNECWAGSPEDRITASALQDRMKEILV
ncbi:tyrosine kinase family catalytic domain protein [Rhizoctonia solani AG-3 Rhs1AP]|uniref:Tyrosine kinase family catalytic domain protein n=2 Tax=Rhizoctonia solani AG-3 TaxID=1086053 RepID=A0A074RPA1_9AGAM|nr:tyrosine kinase family catalytic domain protein [Rhizoctonia solani AG-3 Rhs1AP]KEP46518.1 tyrosine kinase family catalytic domain protein [Rhizoctonia solani 123E]